jgi:hypothetical protein
MNHPIEIWFWVFTTIFAGVGAYLGSYLKKKGEILATKEDFDSLRTQTHELTVATKEIEAKVNDQVRNRQRQWEMKKELFIAAAQTVAKADATLAPTVSAYLRRETLRKVGAGHPSATAAPKLKEKSLAAIYPAPL